MGVGLLSLVVAVAGCGPGRGKVSGRVLYNGAPLPGGRVTFRPADPRQNTVSAELNERGEYEAVLPAGEVQVSVDNRELEPRTAQGGGLPPGLPALSAEARKALGGKGDKSPPKPGGQAADRPSGRYVMIPTRYHDVETSGLKFTVQSGDQTHNIELTK
jgi:hypothetical protein